MSEIVISCTCCGRQMVFPEECTLLECPACGTRNAKPRATGTELEILRRAVDQRLACDFHNAEKSYQHVLLEHPDEHEALWGCLLCHYGVEYVEDPHTRRRMPTVHTVRPKPLQEQADFRRACEFAPPEVRAQYELDAAYIDDAQASIRQMAASCQPYDVFICHKTTRTGSHDKTEDFHRATSLYHFLKDQGVRAFFAPESLQSAAGANYEAGIYHALQTAKVMLVVCSDADYLTSAWVRSEWSRFLEMMEVAPDKQLIPLLYDHFSPSRLPKEFLFRRLQGLDMAEITAPQTLTRLLLAAVDTGNNTGTAAQLPPNAQVPVASANIPAPGNASSKPANVQDCIVLRMPPPHKDWKSKLYPIALFNKQTKEKILETWWGETVTIPLSNRHMTIGITWGTDSFRKAWNAYGFQIETNKRYEFYWASTFFNPLKIAIREF